VDTFVRWSGAGLILAGLLILPVVGHPDIFETGFAEPSRSAFWMPGHLAGLLVAVLSVLGLAGLAARYATRLGRLGAVGAVLTVVGLVATASLAAVEAFAFPVLADEDPALLDIDGPLLGSVTFRAVGGLALLWFVGLALVGFAVERARVLPRGAGALLAVAAVAFAAFEGPFVPVLGQLSVVVFAAAYGWVGWALFGNRTPLEGQAVGSAAGLPSAGSGEGRRRSRRTRETAR
jgi:hypothetical protein